MRIKTNEGALFGVLLMLVLRLVGVAAPMAGAVAMMMMIMMMFVILIILIY